jgi:hypothetical protein
VSKSGAMREPSTKPATGRQTPSIPLRQSPEPEGRPTTVYQKPSAQSG